MLCAATFCSNILWLLISSPITFCLWLLISSSNTFCFWLLISFSNTFCLWLLIFFCRHFHSRGLHTFVFLCLWTVYISFCMYFCHPMVSCLFCHFNLSLSRFPLCFSFLGCSLSKTVFLSFLILFSSCNLLIIYFMSYRHTPLTRLSSRKHIGAPGKETNEKKRLGRRKRFRDYFDL